jgi:hypothetical protein
MCVVKSAAAVSGSTFPSRATCLKRKIKGNADGEAGRPGVALHRESSPQQGPGERAFIPVSKITSLKSLSFLVQMFRRPIPTKQFSQATKPFFVFEQTSGNSRWLSVTNETAHSASA